MPKTEKSLSSLLRQSLPKKSHYQRIENRAGEGMPDVYICLSGVPVWVELKIVKSNKVSVSKSQIAWHLAHTRCKGASFFLLYEPSTSDVFLFGGDKVLELQGSRLDDLRPAALYIGKMDGLPCALRPAALDMWGW